MRKKGKRRDAYLVAGSLLLVGAAIAGGGYAYVRWSGRATQEARSILKRVRSMNDDLEGSVDDCKGMVKMVRSWTAPGGEIERLLASLDVTLESADELSDFSVPAFQSVVKDIGKEVSRFTQIGALYAKSCPGEDVNQAYDIAGQPILRVGFDLSRASDALR